MRKMNDEEKSLVGLLILTLLIWFLLSGCATKEKELESNYYESVTRIMESCNQEVGYYEEELNKCENKIIDKNFEPTTNFPKKCVIQCKDFNFTILVTVAPRNEDLSIPFSPHFANEETYECKTTCGTLI